MCRRQPALKVEHYSVWTSSHTSSHTSSISGEQHEEGRMFSLDKLKVCDQALASAASLAQHSRSWDKRHAVTDQLLRASESFVLNLAEGARLRSAAKRQHLLDYAIGWALECAACLDIAQIKEFLCQDEALEEKRSLCEVVRHVGPAACHPPASPTTWGCTVPCQGGTSAVDFGGWVGIVCRSDGQNSAPCRVSSELESEILYPPFSISAAVSGASFRVAGWSASSTMPRMK